MGWISHLYHQYRPRASLASHKLVTGAGSATTRRAQVGATVQHIAKRTQGASMAPLLLSG